MQSMQNDLETLRSHLQALEALADAPNPDGRSLQGPFLLAQQHFQQRILPLGDPYPAVQPMLTELNRGFRLLAMDVAFLQAARQSLTAQQRQQQMGDKLGQLLGFCEALIQTLTDVPASDD
jgi:hypothetical protein